MSSTVSRPSLLIFDLDGTLVDSLPFFLSVVNELAQRHRFRPIQAEELDTLRQWDAARILRHQGVALWKVPLVAADYKARMAQAIAGIPLFAGMGEVLHALRTAGRTLAVVSSNSEANVKSALGPDLAALFSYYECGVSLFGKAAKLRHLIRLSGHAVNDTMYIGDELRDAQAAREVGIAFGAVGWGYTHLAALVAGAPQATFTCPQDITAYFDDSASTSRE